jgi:ribosome-associated translation inhibitor RaiA
MRGASRFRIVLRADLMAADAYLSADQAASNLEKRLRRYHRRLKDNHGNGAATAAPRTTSRWSTRRAM